MANTLVGKVLEIGQTITIPSRSGGNGFTKRTLTLDCSRYDQYTGQQYENFPQFEFSGQKVSALDGFNVGDLVEVSFALSGRKYIGKDGTERNFTSVVGYKVEHCQNGQQPAAPQAAAPAPASAPVMQGQQANVDDGLPF